MQESPSQLAAAVAAAKSHPQAGKIGEVAAEVAAAIADARVRHAKVEDVEAVAKRVELDKADAQTEFGNVLAILERGAEDKAERAIVSAFVARGVATLLESKEDAALFKQWAERLTYLGAHVGFEPFAAFPVGIPSEITRGLHKAVAEHARAIDEGKVPNADRAQLLVAAAAVADAVEILGASDELAPIASRLAADIGDPIAARVLTAHVVDAPSTVAASTRDPAVPSLAPATGAVRGHIAPVPRGTFLTFVYAFSGWLLVRSLGILIARYVLSLKRDATIQLKQSGLEIDAKVGLLGRQLRDLSALYPARGLASVTREVRFPSLHVYAGLVMLLVGTYAGVTFLAWGVPATSPRLIGYGALILLLGVVLDLLITSLVPGARGRCRLIIVPKRGSRVCIGDVDAHAADRLLSDLARRVD